MDILKIYLIGLAILIVAILVNGLSKKIKIVNWYDYLLKVKKPKGIDYIWLLILYPFLLGIVAYYAYQLIY